MLRLIHDLPAPGAWNMAVDEMMLELVAAGGEPILRFYRWSEPTLSLGYFQALAERQAHLSSLGCPVVRRSTGGGAILHHHEITYSIALPVSDRWSAQAAALYDIFHRGLAKVLREDRFSASLCPATLRRLPEPFLCFERRAQGDVLLASGEDSSVTHKIAGSAQRRRHGALVQHGSVILAKSSVAPEIDGIGEICGRTYQAAELIGRWLTTIGRELPGTLTKSGWNASEIARAESLQDSRFESAAWLERRGGK